MRLPIVGLLTTIAIIFAIWVSGTRIIVIQPIGAIPDGITVIVLGIHNVNFIDSPDAICQRMQGGVSLLCRGATAAAISQKGTILLRLPYSEYLFRLSGAPRLDR